MAQPLYSPPIPGMPEGAPEPINLSDLGMILKMLIKNPKLRTDMFADPATTIAKLNFVAHPAAVKFFASLKGADFEDAATAFAPSHADPAIGMAEI